MKKLKIEITENNGYKQKYLISKADGTPVDPKADYFVLRLDTDPHAIKALEAYAESVRDENGELADDIVGKLANEYGSIRKGF